MCGVAGFLDLSAGTAEIVARERIRLMCDAIAHRGPDGFGCWVDPAVGIALGHRRLAIIDLTDAGRQPMTSADGRYVITYNGEIYNFTELRRDLEESGRSFRGGSDTEVMLAAISEWGLARALKRFVGMFGFALWDREARTLSLVRDRLGVKPIYWTVNNGHVLFASELKALMRHPVWCGKLDYDAIKGFLRYSYIPGPATAFVGVRQVEPGCVVRIDSTGEVRADRYWDAREELLAAMASPFGGSDEEAVDCLDELLRHSVSIRMISDVPLGAFLSGGIDSSTVAACMQAQSTRPIRTFAIGFEEKEFDEAPFAKAVAAHLGTDHTEVYFTARDALEAVSSIPDWFDEPFADPSQLPTYLVAKAAKEHVTVALSGDGGDELFAGYPRYSYAEQLWQRINRLPRTLRAGLAGVVLATPEPWLDRAVRLLVWGPLPLSPGRKLHRAAALFSVDTADDVHHRLAEVWADADRLTRVTGGIRLAEDLELASRVPSFLARMRYYDLQTYLPGDILTKVDRTSMAVSLEAREPLLDHRLVQFAMSLPDQFLRRNGSGKWVLRAVLNRYLPRELFERPKKGFSIPTGAWLRGPLREWGEALLAPARIRRDEFLDVAEVQRLWAEHQDGRANRETILWNILMLQAWRERYDV